MVPDSKYASIYAYMHIYGLNMHIFLHGFSPFQLLLSLTSYVYVHKWLASSNLFQRGFFLTMSKFSLFECTTSSSLNISIRLNTLNISDKTAGICMCLHTQYFASCMAFPKTSKSFLY